ncbi:Pseudouridine synthase [Aspergillus sclerotialis]|uniref:tRNA pseudouridine(55) synthase n=1 Tax=Aspergillus sclerotialis TaxID=2070753 RepID=A0A3A2ZCL5_9EURO|nr:Pseudouridine synthase [Aspergillus sclerotialis]
MGDETNETIYEGIFAVNKPQGVTSADVIRKLKEHFHPSALFKPCMELDRKTKAKENYKERRKRRMKQPELKMGHGGTLDPLASGVLIIGVLKGTKDLPMFLGKCTKTYEATILFGAETDSYDCLGKLIRKRPYDHITREKVEEALNKFRGNFMQQPPLFSALKYKGKKLYEYAREGKVPPVMPEPRPVEVSKLEIVEWYDPGTHEYKWPEEAPKELRDAADQILENAEAGTSGDAGEGQVQEVSSAKRKSLPPAESQTEGDTVEEPAPAAKKQKVTEEGDAAQTEQSSSTAPEAVPEAAETSTTPPKESEQVPQPPAVKVRMTVSSGFYVRSLAHDLGRALDSCGIMTALVRTQQSDFILDPEQVLEYKDLDAGEEVWGPKVKRFLENWEARKAAPEAEARRKSPSPRRRSQSPSRRSPSPQRRSQSPQNRT